MARALRTLKMTKMQAAGNDFVVMNGMTQKIPAPARLAEKICHRQYGIGADGLILLQPAANGASDYRMRIINSDGSEAEMCGNGSRCTVKFAVENKIAGKDHTFETLAGRIHGKYLSPNLVRVQLPAPTDFIPRVAVRLASGRIHGSFINTGVPHFVVFVPRVESVDVCSLGRQIRRHRIFAPKGTNVNFVQIIRATGRPVLRVRTYERGVESETLACGTGATASAVIAALTRNLKSPITVRTSGGATLVIDFERVATQKVARVAMRGPVVKVFETRWPI